MLVRQCLHLLFLALDLQENDSSSAGSSWPLLVPVAAADVVVALVLRPQLTVSTAMEICRPQA